MELNSKQKEALKKIAEIGYVGNWYKAFGKPRLHIYKADLTEMKYVTVSINFAGLEISTPFYTHEESKELTKEFYPALEAVSDVFHLKK